MRLNTKSAAVRAALSSGKPMSIDRLRWKVEATLKQVVGRATLYQLLATMQSAGQITTSGRASERRYSLVRGKA